MAAALASQTEKLRFLGAVRPGLQSPTLTARMTATLDRMSGGWLLVNVVTGGDPVENAGDGIHLSHAERYEVTREFLDIYKALMAGQTVNYESRHFRVIDGNLLFAPLQQGGPQLYFGGSSDAASAVAAKQVDKYLTCGEPPEQVRAKIEGVPRLAEAEGREVSFGIPCMSSCGRANPRPGRPPTG
ncbi:LLM class flavin-dependent oxidoreductase [Paracoccus ravus]|uniref:LLM class flavin-dependent oxidoreductase n=1 Tax=Paracoccus ravus TaxID=2447760 RepID=UPI001FD69435|nr:LLM class flavin-dependent oxidoreductase [Paracoccus ravus]